MTGRCAVVIAESLPVPLLQLSGVETPPLLIACSSGRETRVDSRISN
jgi:hypothetical protein